MACVRDQCTKCGRWCVNTQIGEHSVRQLIFTNELSLEDLKKIEGLEWEEYISSKLTQRVILELLLDGRTIPIRESRGELWLCIAIAIDFARWCRPEMGRLLEKIYIEKPWVEANEACGLTVAPYEPIVKDAPDYRRLDLIAGNYIPASEKAK